MVTKTWNVGSGSWFMDADWTPTGAPTSGDDVVIPAGDSDLGFGSYTVSSVTIAVGATLEGSSSSGVSTTGAFTNNGTFLLQNGGSALIGGLLTNTNNLTVMSGAFLSQSAGVTAGSLLNTGTVLVGGFRSTFYVMGASMGGGTIKLDFAAKGELGGPSDNVLDFVTTDGASCALDDPSHFTGKVTEFDTGDQLILSGEQVTILSYDGTTLKVQTADGTVQSFAVSGAAPNSLVAASSAAGTTISVSPICFASGAMIRTSHGDRPVETLAVGDTVVTASGTVRPIRWIGRRALDCAGHPAPATVRPIRIRAGAFGCGRPYRDLFLSPHHAVAVTCVEDVLIPIGLLVNGSTIAQIETDEIVYWHVELDSHDVLLANGLAAESYIDVGNRCEFEGGASLVLHPSFENANGAGYCLPLVAGGAILSAVRTRLADIAGAAEHSVTGPKSIVVIADGIVIESAARRELIRFIVPAGTCDLRLVSPTFRPNAFEDHRTLGVMIEAIAIDDGFGTVLDVPLDDPGLIAGFHPVERTSAGTWRWTAGDAHLAASLWAHCHDDFILRIRGQFEFATDARAA